MRNTAAKMAGTDPFDRLRRLRGDVDQPDDASIRSTVTRLYATPDGEKFLLFLWDRTYGRRLGDGATESAWKELEAQRKLVDDIFRLIEG